MYFIVNFCYNKKMEKINLKKVSLETRKNIKQQVIQLLKKGVKHKEIADTLNISLQTVDRISSAYKKEGMKCLQEKTRGRKIGEKRQLTLEQEKEILNILIHKTPDQMELCFMLWTRGAVCQLIQKKYNITITLRNMSEYLKRWGITCQYPTKKAYFQDNVKLDIFMREIYPVIVKQAQKENAIIFWGDEIENGVIFWGDETEINNQVYHVCRFAPKGQIITVSSFSEVEKISMISAISNQGTCHFLCYDENITQQRFINFMERLVKGKDRKVLFIVNNLKVYHGELIVEWLSKHEEEIELFFILPYSSKTNFNEYLNHNLK